MKLNKTKLIILSVFIVGLVIIATPAVFGQSGFSQIFQSIFLDTDVEPAVKKEGCDQNSTTTDCAKITVQQEKNNVHVQEQPIEEQGYGPLTNTYTNEKYGFSLMYPDEMEIHEGSEVILRDKKNSKKFALKICTPDTPCGQYYTTFDSLSDFEKEIVREDGGRQTILYSYKFDTPNGNAALKRQYQYFYFDSEGKDITSKVCEMCILPLTQYIFFKNSDNFVIFWQIRGDESITEEITKTINY